MINTFGTTMKTFNSTSNNNIQSISYTSSAPIDKNNTLRKIINIAATIIVILGILNIVIIVVLAPEHCAAQELAESKLIQQQSSEKTAAHTSLLTKKEDFKNESIFEIPPKTPTFLSPIYYVLYIIVAIAIVILLMATP